MKGKRTGLDFEKHELRIIEQDDLSVHYLRKPNTACDSIKFINTQGILAVTGDYGNWIFCREFHPGPKESVSDGYWKEKLKILSCQEAERFDAEKTEAQIRERLAEADCPDEYKEYYSDLLIHIEEGEITYLYHALNDAPNGMDYEYIPLVKSVNPWLLTVFDGFDEICRRIKSGK
jgi:hypothetical protein